MRLQTQLMLLLVFVALVPVSISGVTSAWLSHAALEQTQVERLAAQARQLADQADGDISASLTDLRLGASVLQLPGLSTQEQLGAVTLLYRQHDRFNIAALLTADGDGVGDPLFKSAAEPTDGREPLDPTELDAFSQHIPLAAALRAGAAIGPSYSVAGKPHPLMALAVAVPLEDGKRGVVAVELSLAALLKRVQVSADESHGAAWLVDASGKPFSGARNIASVLTVPAEAGIPVDTELDHANLELSVGGVPSLVSVARMERLPWSAVVAQDVEGALAPVRNILAQSGFWIVVALICSLLFGAVLARAFTAPIHALVRAAEAFQRADFTHRTPPLKPKEMDGLGTAFNRMAVEIQRRDEELRAFNAELQKRVEERTRDLKEAQDQLIHAQKMAAVGELGAGVAHEINNPLAGVIGLIQLRLLRAAPDDPTTQTFKDIEREALRIRDIVQNLLALTPQKNAADALVDVNRVVDSALGLMTRPIVAARIQVKKELDANLPKIRGRASDLQQSVVALLSNARNAMPDGGTLTVSTRSVDGKLIKLLVEDTGPGIAPEIMDRIFEPFFTTKPTPDSKGLGLAMVHRVVQDHGGKIAVDSGPGRGAAFSITLTAAREKTHLV